MTDVITPQNVIGGIMTGVLGLLWLDIRRFRKEIDGQLRAKLDATTHNLLCENATLKIKQHIDDALDEMIKSRREELGELKRDLLKAIKSNGD